MIRLDNNRKINSGKIGHSDLTHSLGISMSKTAPFIIAALAAMTLTACQSTPTAPIITRADSTYETTGLGKTKIIAQNNALSAAKQQCGHKTPVVITDNTTYHGVIDERMGRVVEQGAKVVGTILGTGTPDLSRDDDYEYFIKFQCQ